ncbi:MAG: mitochondrial F1-F0 ATP synthase subunit F of fungi-domain-containing protein [Piptocephalis tieghemiana]|nr:MAG: mitochondrial F1-F0 ATP synthase subunit F of fungi-domain-containing protein [Piptocephalis tieghemiana]
MILRAASPLKNFIPPNLAPARKAVAPGKTAVAPGTARLIDFYTKLPKGPAPAPPAPSGLFGRYRAKYIDGKNASIAPVLHVAGFFFAVGYAFDYHFHLKHHKNVEHH